MRERRGWRLLLALTASPLCATQPAHGQAATWLDPASSTPEAQACRALREYLESKGEDLAGGAGNPTSRWVADEQAKWPMYDLAGFYVPLGAVPEVSTVRPLAGQGGAAYEVVVHFFTSKAGAKGELAMTATWLVKRQTGRWRIANVLTERTRAWNTHRVGQITYHLEPGLEFNRARALQAVKFIDSLASAFVVPRLEHLDYYLTATVDGALNALGVEYPTRFGPGGGFAKPVNRQLFAAVSAWGENYRHELAHLVLRPALNPATMTILASEGIATWYGGSAGKQLPAAVAQLRDYLRVHPGASLDAAMSAGGMPQAETYAAGAVLCELLFRRGGISALKEFLAAGPSVDKLRAALTRVLGTPWEEIRTEWRASVDRLAAQ